MKKIIISLVIIGVVAGITLGITGAWWTDKATSSNTSFTAGTMDLKLANSDANGNPTGGWLDDVTQTWDYENMVPGGESEGAPLWLRNNGSTPADWLKFETVTNPNPVTMNEVMRITKLAYAGESLLEGGAGADLSAYEGPEINDCQVIVDGDYDGDSEFGTIQLGINAANNEDLVCVRNGTYNESLTIDKEITLASFNGVNGVTIKGTVTIEADNVTLEGFSIKNFSQIPTPDWSGVYIPSGTDIRVANNLIDGAGIDPVANLTVGIHTLYGASAEATLENNVVKNVRMGIYNQGATLFINKNTIENTAHCAIGVDTSLVTTITGNTISDSASLGIEVFRVNVVANYNNIVNSEDYGVWAKSGVYVNAKNNWWGDYNPSDQVSGSVNTKGYLGGPHVGFINGSDQNENGFADLEDLHFETIVVEDPQLDSQKKFELEVQLDGPTSSNDHQGGSVGLDVTVTMGQGPTQ